MAHYTYIYLKRTRHVQNRIQEGNTPDSYIYVRTVERRKHSVVVVSCGDVHSESHSAGVDTVQAQGWSVVEREQPFAELEAAKKFAENVRPLNLQ